MTLREALTADAKTLHRVRLRAIRAGWRSWYSDDQIEGWCRLLRADYYAEALQAGLDGVLVALDDGSVAGFVHVDWRRSRLCALYVDPEHARRGHAARLMARVERDLLVRQRQLLRLSASLPSERFYLERGYRRVRRHIYRLPCRVEVPSVLMKKHFGATANEVLEWEAAHGT